MEGNGKVYKEDKHLSLCARRAEVPEIARQEHKDCGEEVEESLPYEMALHWSGDGHCLPILALL